MLRLIFILFGGDALIKRWRVIFGLGLLTLLAALAVLGDLVDGVVDIAVWTLGLLLLALAFFEMLAGAMHTHMRRQLGLLRSFLMLAGASLVLDFPWDNAIAAGVIFGAVFQFNGLLRLLACWLIRYPNWQFSAVLGGGYVVVSLLLLTAWPLRNDLNVSFCLGLALLAAGAVLVRSALQIRHLPPGTRLASITFYGAALSPKPLPKPDHANPARSPQPLIVHVWTAVTATDDRIRLPVIERYIVALSRKGNVYSGHCALECGPDVYISHHPRDRLRIDASNALQQVRATSENNRSGRWGSSYSEEAAAGRPSTLKIRFRSYNAQYLQTFWQGYRQDATYNFTHRNCSSVVAQSIDAAVEGIYADKPFWPTLLRLLGSIDMWHASRVRARAEALAWSPGFVLDYASTLRRITRSRQKHRLQTLRLWRMLRKRTAVSRTR